jgi:hypothetical protein
MPLITFSTLSATLQDGHRMTARGASEVLGYSDREKKVHIYQP